MSENPHKKGGKRVNRLFIFDVDIFKNLLPELPSPPKVTLPVRPFFNELGALVFLLLFGS